MNRKKTSGSLFLNLLLIIVSFTCVFPLVWLAYSSLKTDPEFLSHPFALPSTLEWENYYLALIKSKILNYFFNTIYNAAGTVLTLLFFAFCIGYFLSRYNFKGKWLVTALLTLGMVVPAYSLLVPMYMQYKLFDLVNKRGIVILPYIAVNLPLGVFLIEAYIKTIPTELEQAAMIEGASTSYTLRHIILPIARPILVTVAILTFNFAWNEMPFSLILDASENVRNIGVGIMNFASGYDAKWTQRVAACAISLFPVALLYVFFNRQIIQGMTEGAVKG